MALAYSIYLLAHTHFSHTTQTTHIRSRGRFDAAGAA